MNSWRWVAPVGVVLVLAAFASSLGRLVPAGVSIQRLALVEPSEAKRLTCSEIAIEKPLVILVLGQSNAANHGGKDEVSRFPAVPVFHGNDCFLASDPMPGATGRGGSIWPRLAQQLLPQRVMFSVLAVESTSVADWVEPGFLKWELGQRISSMRRHGIGVDLVIWQQGEADARQGTLREAYFRDFNRLLSFLRDGGVMSPIMVARSTYCRGFEGGEVRLALQELSDSSVGVWLGPDTDNLLGDSRRDDCHFSAVGLNEAAKLWARAIEGRVPEILAARSAKGVFQ